MRVSSIQLASSELSKAAQIERVLPLLDRTAGSDLVLLPEMWPCGYFSFDRYATDAEPIDGPLASAMAEKARQLRTHLLMGSFPERDGDQLYNSTILFDPQGRQLARYRKVHLFSFQSEERDRLSRGTDVVTVETALGKLGLAICYDLRFPEMFRRLSAEGVETFLVTSAWPAARLESWRLFNQVRASENLANLISCNATGINRGQTLAGHSMMVGPFGQVLAEGADREEIVTAEMDPALPAHARRGFSALQDRIFY